MHVKLTASALATAALLCGTAHASAQGASRTLDSDTTLTDTAFNFILLNYMLHVDISSLKLLKYFVLINKIVILIQ